MMVIEQTTGRNKMRWFNKIENCYTILKTYPHTLSHSIQLGNVVAVLHRDIFRIVFS